MTVKHRNRIVDKILSERLQAAGAVVVEGAKWCGKTTTCERVARSALYLGDPEQHDKYRVIAETEIGRLLRGEVPRLIDEWQDVPRFWDAIRHHVDQVNGLGQFVLTGSRHHIARRMAGCMAVLVLLQRVAKDLQGADRGAIEFRIRYLFRKCMAFVQANRGILSEATSCGCAFSDVPPEKMIALSRRIRFTWFKRRIRKYIGFLFAGKRE